MKDVTQIVYDLSAVEADNSMPNSKKFNTLKDYVMVLKAEVAQFSYIVNSAEKSKPECQEIVKTYVETLKGLWTQVTQEIRSAETTMALLLKTGQI